MSYICMSSRFQFRVVMFATIFHVNNYVQFVFIPFVFKGFMIYLLFVFIYVFWCPTRFQYQMVFASFNSNEQELLTLSEHPNSSPIFSGVCVHQSLVFCVVFCKWLFVYLYIFFLAVVLSVLHLLITGHCIVCPSASGYSFGIFKLFLGNKPLLALYSVKRMTFTGKLYFNGNFKHKA